MLMFLKVSNYNMLAVHSAKKAYNKANISVMYFLLPLSIEGDIGAVQPDFPFPRKEETDGACAVIRGGLATRVVMDLQGKRALHMKHY